MYSLWSRWQSDCSSSCRMDTRLARFKQIVMALGVTALAVPGAAYAQAAPDAKLDESLRESVERGCVGTQPVIIRTKRGYRQAVRDSLTAHGDVIKGEFPSLDAIAAVVHCDDLSTLPAFDSVASVSLNGPVAVQSLTRADPDQHGAAQSSRPRVRPSWQQRPARSRRKRLCATAEKAAALANSQVTAAKKALIVANRLTGACENYGGCGGAGKAGAGRGRSGRCTEYAGDGAQERNRFAGVGAQRAEGTRRCAGSAPGSGSGHCRSASAKARQRVR